MMTTKKTKTARQEQARVELRAMGAELRKTEDRFGETRTGWWLDGVWGGPTNDPEHALRTIRG